jgi:hypothetical protein
VKEPLASCAAAAAAAGGGTDLLLHLLRLLLLLAVRTCQHQRQTRSTLQSAAAVV